MDVAARCGVDDVESPLMLGARSAWARWCREDPELAVVCDLADLRTWTRTASHDEKATVTAALATRTEHDQTAVAALVWLLIPGACVLAEELHDLAPEIDALVAGQLWIEAASSWRLRGPGIAGTILRRVRRAVCADLGVGDGARRRDRSWATSVRMARLDDTIAAAPDTGGVDPFWQVTELLMEAMDDHVLGVFDAWLIGELAQVAHYAEAAGRRGRMGLTTPGVVETVAQHVRLSPRALRRRAVKAVDRIAEYLAVRDDPARFAVWKARHPPVSLTAREQMQLVIDEDESAYWIRARSRVAGGSVHDASPGSRRSAGA
ncbi:MAG TPA: hypothetical protein VFJ19_02875 [Nocardioidaceae bacterium]|nr:hypothetical protein [Nocardioidaceae bacterium]